MISHKNNNNTGVASDHTDTDFFTTCSANESDLENEEPDLFYRKKSRCPNKWLKNERKFKRNSGQKYTSVKGKVVPAKSVKTAKCEHKGHMFPDFKCHELSDEDRNAVFREYWSSGSYERQRDFIIDCTEGKKCKTHRAHAKAKNIRI